MRGRSPILTSLVVLPLGAILLAPGATRADDIKLKDGSKVSGTIVGFEENSFKVKTSYGFAIVQKDQVVSISMSDAPKPAADKPSEPVAEKPAPAEKRPAMATPKAEALKPIAPPLPAMSGASSQSSSESTAMKSEPGPASEKVASKSVPAPLASAKPASPGASKSATAAPTKPATAATATNAAVPVVNSAPPQPPAPEPIKEAVNGNVYTNETYRFHMYKPPNWDVIATAPKVLPGAITAMGTGDDTTYLLIGQESAPTGKSIASNMDTTEKRLRDVMGNFRALDEKQITISGTAATEHRFRGSVDQHDWSGVVVLVPRGSKLFTIFGMTRADNDLVQIQENVIARAISSLQFTD